MGLQNKRSDTPGARANLIPGEIGVQQEDGLLLMRGRNRKIEIDIERWRERAAPAEGDVGALLTNDGSSVVWDSSVAPSGVVDGVVSVDPPALGIPGFYPQSSGGVSILGPNSVLVEPFYVASDYIVVTALAAKVSGATGVLTLGIYDEDDQRVTSHDFVAPPNGLNENQIILPLARGHYKALLWTANSVTVTTVSGHRFNQGLEFAVRTPRFLRRYTSSGPNSGGVDLASLDLTPSYDTTPGEDKAVLLRWELP